MNKPWSKGLVKPTERINLHQHNTPFFKWNIPENLLPKKLLQQNTQFYIKRDDFTGFEYSGNKIRKLEFLLADAKKKGCDTLVSYGKKQSNWCRAVATAGAKLGFEVHLILNCGDECTSSLLSSNYLVDVMMGAHIHPISSSIYEKYDDNYHDNKLLLLLTDYLNKKKGKKCYPLCCGGSNLIGTWGYIDMIGELEEQYIDPNITDIIVATASGGTAIGIGIGTYLSSKFNKPKIHAMTTMGENIKYYTIIGNKLLKDINFTKLTNINNINNLISFNDATGIGYGKNTKNELNFFYSLSKSTGIMVDPIYNGKALYYFIKGIKNGNIKNKGNKILFIHTGGTFAYFDNDAKRSKIYNLNKKVNTDFVSKL